VTYHQRHLLHASLILALSASASAQSHTDAFQALASQPSQYSSFTAPDAIDLPDDPSELLQAISIQTPQNETPEQKKAREQHEEAEREVKKQEKQRAGGVLPLFNVVISGQTVPLSPKEKFDISFHTIIDPYTIGLAVLGGAIGEIEDDHTGYGHGPAGYFKRFGASYADNAIGNVVGNAMLPIVLHQDPRYYRKGQGSIKSRIFYSAMTSFICFGDNGKKQFNASNVLGNFVAGGISNIYYPSDERGFGLTVSNATYVTLEGMLGAQILEFSPDVNDYIHKRREHHRAVLAARAASRQATPAAPNQPQ
jgi:hypothetical protein